MSQDRGNISMPDKPDSFQFITSLFGVSVSPKVAWAIAFGVVLGIMAWKKVGLGTLFLG